MTIPFRSLALGVSVLLAGCGGTVNQGLESVHQPVVSRTDYALDLATDGAELAPGEAVRLNQWLAAMNLRYGDAVSVDDPAGTGYAVRDAIGAEAARHGVVIAQAAPLTPGAIEPGMVRVVLTRTIAWVPGCPDGSRNAQPNYSARTTSGHGCAINSNLAAMVASPGDLIQGRSDEGATDQEVASKAVGTFRRNAPSGAAPLPTETTGGRAQ